jgi:hypothetical protein
MLGLKKGYQATKGLYGLGVKTYSGMRSLGHKALDVMNAVSPYIPALKLPAQALQTGMNMVHSVLSPIHNRVKTIANTVEMI